MEVVQAVELKIYVIYFSRDATALVVLTDIFEQVFNDVLVQVMVVDEFQTEWFD